MIQHAARTRSLRLLPCLLTLLTIFSQFANTSYAQTAPVDPGQDVFGGSPGGNALFEGYNAESPVNTLFNGDTQQDNGMFTTPPTQLGGATPYLELIQPQRTNQGNPSFIVLTSKYAPSGDLTSSSVITLTVNVHNVGKDPVTGIKLIATLQDKNAALVDTPKPNPPFDAGSSIDAGLTWSKLAGNKPFDLQPDQSADFSWSFKANKDDTILRWKFVADYGAGESILLQWIPIKNPNPQAGGTSSGSSSGSFNNPCTNSGGSGPFPDSDTGQQIVDLFKQHWNIILTPGTDSSAGSPADYTSSQYHGMLKAWWEVLTTVECTPYLTKAIGSSPLTIQGYANGGMWWGEYMGGNVQYMWIDNISQGTIPHIKQNLIHELGHVFEGANPDIGSKFEANVCGKGSVHPYISGYGEYGMTVEGNGCNESFAEMNGYYVERDSNEWGVGTPYCPTKNPYDWNESIYYDFAKTEIFGGKEYGPPAPNPPTSC